MKKYLGVLLVLLLVMVGCSSESENIVYKIGVIQLADHPSLDATFEGLIEVLDEKLGADNYVVDYQNALGDPTNVNTMSQKLVDDGNDIIYAIATNAAQAAYAAAESAGIPVVFNAVTDPVDAGLVNTMDKPGKHATGVSDVAPIDLQLAMLKEMLPDAKNIGMLYNTGETNSLVQIQIAEAEATKLGLTIIKQGISQPSDIDTATQQLVERWMRFIILLTIWLFRQLPKLLQSQQRLVSLSLRQRMANWIKGFWLRIQSITIIWVDWVVKRWLIFW